MLVQYCIDNNGDYGGEVGFSTNFDEDNNKATSLEDGARRSTLALPAQMEGALNKKPTSHWLLCFGGTSQSIVRCPSGNGSTH